MYFKNFTIPNIQQPFYCGQHVLLAHSQAYRLGKSMMANSTIAWKANGGYKIPLTNSSEDAEAVQRAWDFTEGWWSDPIYLTGDYNAAVKAFVSTFLRPFTAGEKATILGSADIYAHDAYTVCTFDTAHLEAELLANTSIVCQPSSFFSKAATASISIGLCSQSIKL